MKASKGTSICHDMIRKMRIMSQSKNTEGKTEEFPVDIFRSYDTEVKLCSYPEHVFLWIYYNNEDILLLFYCPEEDIYITDG